MAYISENCRCLLSSAFQRYVLSSGPGIACHILVEDNCSSMLENLMLMALKISSASTGQGIDTMCMKKGTLCMILTFHKNALESCKVRGKGKGLEGFDALGYLHMIDIKGTPHS